MIKVNIDKARDIAKDHIRKLREPELARLDVEFMRALETGGDHAAIAAQKQVLRDLPAQLDDVTDVEALAQVMKATEL